MSSTLLQSAPGYPAAVTEETRSHDDVGSRSAPPVTYSDLLSRLVDDEPTDGYERPSQLGPLSFAELAALLSEESTVLSDATVDDSLVASIIQTLRDLTHTEMQRNAMIGAAVLSALQSQARTYLLYEVQEEIGRKNERAWERRNEDFYGSAAPQTDLERMMSDRGLREGNFR